MNLQDIVEAVRVLQENNAPAGDRGRYWLRMHPQNHRKLQQLRRRWRLRIRLDGLAGSNVVRRLHAKGYGA